MKVNLYINLHNPYYDWCVIPSILIGIRNNDFSYRVGDFISGFGIALIFLKAKVELRIYKVNAQE
jgi:hypothetical protein